MTRTEARWKLEEAFPGRSVSLAILDLSEIDGPFLRRHTTEYRISVWPGPDGTVCQVWIDDSLDGATKKALANACASPERQRLDAEFAPEESAATV